LPTPSTFALNPAKQESRLETSIQAGARPANGARRCVLNRTGNYTEILQLRPLEALRGCVELQVLSVLAESRAPQAERVRYRTVLPRECLAALSELLDACACGAAAPWSAT
jgi:hypothetical protein